MLKFLKQVCDDNRCVSIYSNSNDMSKFIYGRIISVNEDYIAIYMISPDGDFDGILVKQVDEVVRVEVGGQYDEKMKKLLLSCELPAFDHIFCDNFFESLLQVAVKTKKIVSIELMNSGYDDVVGYAEELNRETCTIKQVDSYGHSDGVSIIAIDRISQISYDSQNEQRILKLCGGVN